MKASKPEPGTHALAASRRIRDEAEHWIPGGLFNPGMLIDEKHPIYCERAEGVHVWDADGNRYLDFVLGFGPVILGHAYPRIRRALGAELERGWSFPFEHPLQGKLAELLTRAVPCAEQVLLFKTGSCATSAAVRLARVHTGREVALRAGYNGWHDWALANHPHVPSAGVPAATAGTSFPFEALDAEALERLCHRHRGDVACVVVSPEAISGDPFPTLAELRRALEDLAAIARRAGALLVFDEIKTGFRVALGGIQELCGVVPDLATFSKAIANGLPLSAVAGRRAVMRHALATKIGGTFQSEGLALVAAIHTLEEIAERGVIAHVWARGEELIDGINAALRESGSRVVAGGQILPPMPMLRLPGARPAEEVPLLTRVALDCLAHGVLIHPWHNWFIALGHRSEDVRAAARTIAAAVTRHEQADGSHDGGPDCTSNGAKSSSR